MVTVWTRDPDEVRQWLEETYPAIEAQAARENAEILWTDEVGVEADHHPGTGYAREGERATMEVPGPHIRVKQIAAISNDGTVRFMTYQGALNAAVFLLFLRKLVEASRRKILLIADRLQAHKTPEVMSWLAAHQDRIEVFFLPAYAPELNPVEYLNNDMKGEEGNQPLTRSWFDQSHEIPQPQEYRDEAARRQQAQAAGLPDLHVVAVPGERATSGLPMELVFVQSGEGT